MMRMELILERNYLDKKKIKEENKMTAKDKFYQGMMEDFIKAGKTMEEAKQMINEIRENKNGEKDILNQILKEKIELTNQKMLLHTRIETINQLLINAKGIEEKKNLAGELKKAYDKLFEIERDLGNIK